MYAVDTWRWALILHWSSRTPTFIQLQLHIRSATPRSFTYDLAATRVSALRELYKFTWNDNLKDGTVPTHEHEAYKPAPLTMDPIDKTDLGDTPQGASHPNSTETSRSGACPETDPLIIVMLRSIQNLPVQYSTYARWETLLISIQSTRGSSRYSIPRIELLFP